MAYQLHYADYPTSTGTPDIPPPVLIPGPPGPQGIPGPIGPAGGSYTLPMASTTVLGGVMVDGTTATVTAGVLTATGSVASVAGRTGAVTLTHTDITDWTATLAPYAPLAGPALTGAPTAPTATAGTNTTQIATTGFVQAAVAAGTAGVASFNSRTGIVTLSGADVTAALTFTPASLASPALTGDPTAPTAAVGDNDTSVATTAFVTNALLYRNYADNSGFAVNQRTYVSGTALAAAAFGHDRWKGGAGGGTYTFVQSPGPATTITITAGTLQQVVEGASLVGGNYTLSWAGTAQGRVGAGTYAASPVALTGIAAGANATIEFNAGTLGRVNLEAGTVATPWQAEVRQQDLARCQRFYQIGTYLQFGAGIAAAGFGGTTIFPVVMRGTPTVVYPSPTLTNLASLAASSARADGMLTMGSCTAAGQTGINTTFTASADI